MSRSYKKHPYYKCAPGKLTKKMCNRRIRRAFKDDDIPSGNAYRKLNDSWELYDYIFDGSWERFKMWNWVREKFFSSEEEAYNHWKKYFRSK